MSKTKTLPSRKRIALEMLNQILGHRSTRWLLAGDTANVWEDIELWIDPDHIFTSCQISLMNKKARSRSPLKQKEPFKWVFKDIISSTAPKRLTIDTISSNCILIFDAYLKIPKLHCMEIITTEEVMDNLDMFRSRYGKIDEFWWWDLKIISENEEKQFTWIKFKEEF